MHQYKSKRINTVSTMMQKLLFILSVIHLCICSDSDLELKVILPQHNSSAPSAGWKRGLEILPGAHVAAESINKRNDILLGYNLSISYIINGQCNDETPNFVFLKQLVMSYYHHQNLAIQLCSNEVKIAMGPIQENDLASILPQYRYDRQLIDALLSMMEQMDWRQIGVITELSNTFFLYTAEAFYQATKGNSKINVTLFTQLNRHESFNIHQQPKVIFVSVSAQIAIEILCQAYEYEQQWPKRAWILHSYWLNDFQSYSMQSKCDLQKAIEGVVIVRNKLQPDSNFTLFSGHSYADYQKNYQGELSKLSKKNNADLRPNPYANVLHDAVWIAALAFNDSQYKADKYSAAKMQGTSNSNTFSFAGAQGQVDINIDGSVVARTIDIIHVKGMQETHVGQYKRNFTFSNISFISEAPSDDIPIQVVGGSTAYTVGLSFEIVINFVVTTGFLALYLYFRNEPEIKSTSLVLSLFIYLGCYLVLIYLILLLVFDQPSDTLNHSYYATLCTLIQWTSGLGIPVPLIVGTMLIKLIRIDYIFHRFSSTGPAPVGRQCSDSFLAILVLLTISPNVLILIIWTAADSYTLTLHYSPLIDGYIEVNKQCTSDKLTIWLAFWMFCLVLQLLALLVVATKTRKIRFMHYKDTKKVNMFIFALNLNIFFTVAYWWFLRNITKRHISGIVSHVGHSALVLLSQIFLFAPKILPPLCRCLSRNFKSSQDSTESI